MSSSLKGNKGREVEGKKKHVMFECDFEANRFVDQRISAFPESRIQLETREGQEPLMARMDVDKSRFPCCLVWTPIPLLTWFLPFIGHMGIAYCNGVIRDFAGPYYVSEDKMSFGKPTRYLQMDANLADGGPLAWDAGVKEASEVYCLRTHNLFCDNCHSHVAMALNLMKYKRKKNWNMVKLAFIVFFCSKHVNFLGFLKTWLPFAIVVVSTILLVIFL